MLGKKGSASSAQKHFCPRAGGPVAAAELRSGSLKHLELCRLRSETSPRGKVEIECWTVLETA